MRFFVEDLQKIFSDLYYHELSLNAKYRTIPSTNENEKDRIAREETAKLNEYMQEKYNIEGLIFDVGFYRNMQGEQGIKVTMKVGKGKSLEDSSVTLDFLG